MDKWIGYFLLALLAIYLLKRLFDALLKKYDWHLWYQRVYLRSWHWKFLRWRKKMWIWINNGVVQCEKCGNKQSLQYHHISYRHLGREPLSDLQIVCNLCHKKGSGRI